MKRHVHGLFMIFAFFALSCFSFSMTVQQTPDHGKIIGKWKIEVSADGEYYYLTLNLKSINGTLEGTISESMGFFSDVPISEIVFDGENLSFEFKSPTPPDGLERLVAAEFKVGIDAMDGIVSIPELGVSVTAAATREKL